MDLGLDSHTALVTGGSRGIGLACARALAAEGVRVALLGRDTDALAAAARSVDAVAREGVGGAVVVEADTTDDQAVRRAVADAVDQLGRLDVVVNAAAPRSQGGDPGAEGVDDDTFLTMVDTKALGYLRVIRAALPHLRDRGGRVVNISGMNARATGSVTGSVRNAAVAVMTKNLADHHGSEGVVLTCVHPGMTVTERTDGDAAFAEKAAGNALGRPVVAEEVARLVTFLASPHSTALNGAVIEVDGSRPGAIWG